MASSWLAQLKINWYSKTLQIVFMIIGMLLNLLFLIWVSASSLPLDDFKERHISTYKCQANSQIGNNDFSVLLGNFNGVKEFAEVLCSKSLADDTRGTVSIEWMPRGQWHQVAHLKQYDLLVSIRAYLVDEISELQVGKYEMLAGLIPHKDLGVYLVSSNPNIEFSRDDLFGKVIGLLRDSGSFSRHREPMGYVSKLGLLPDGVQFKYYERSIDLDEALEIGEVDIIPIINNGFPDHYPASKYLTGTKKVGIYVLDKWQNKHLNCELIKVYDQLTRVFPSLNATFEYSLSECELIQ